VNDVAKERLKKLDNLLINALENLGLKVYQDSVSEDELQDDLGGIYHFAIFETGGMRRAEEKNFTLVQDVLVRLYAENM
ncbi:hypothetical protein NE578_10365, partial [Schaalia odontolytica]|uniref:hypothetical protein n=1 Tax=Schaalia odontolytica TaxID=1660 RepID=UPI0021089894